MRDEQRFEKLVSPTSGAELSHCGDLLQSADGKETFRVCSGIALLATRGSDAESFDKPPDRQLAGLPYFTSRFFEDSIREELADIEGEGPLRVAELGGGEGFWARSLKTISPDAEIFVCDRDLSALRLAPKSLQLVHADIAGPVFREGSLDAAVFWVSLHHLSPAQQASALSSIFNALKPGGRLFMLEPNLDLFLRRIMFGSFLSKDVYFEEETGFYTSELHARALSAGFKATWFRYVNPRYNRQFVRRFGKWFLYYSGLELIFLADSLFLGPIASLLPTRAASWVRRYMTLYIHAAFVKPIGRID